MMKQVYLITFSSIYFIEKGRETLTDASLWVGDDPLHYFFWCGVGAKLKSLTRGRSSSLYFLPTHTYNTLYMQHIHGSCSSPFPFHLHPLQIASTQKRGLEPTSFIPSIAFYRAPYLHILYAYYWKLKTSLWAP